MSPIARWRTSCAVGVERLNTRGQVHDNGSQLGNYRSVLRFVVSVISHRTFLGCRVES